MELLDLDLEQPALIKILLCANISNLQRELLERSITDPLGCYLQNTTASTFRVKGIEPRMAQGLYASRLKSFSVKVKSFRSFRFGSIIDLDCIWSTILMHTQASQEDHRRY